MRNLSGLASIGAAVLISVMTVGQCRVAGAASQTAPATLGVSNVDGAAIGLFEQAPQNWLSNGRTYSEQRYSPLAQINAKNAAKLGMAWQSSLQTVRFGIEATPVVANGIIYMSSAWSRVFAFDAKTGKELWRFNPQVAGEWLRYGCCKPVNRGVAVWKGKIYVGAFDGRLIALDAKTGRKIWEADTIDHKPYYTITGAPRVVKGKVIIGNAGADFGTRGYFSAYDAETGKMVSRFYVVPGDTKKGFENPALTFAAKTWDPNRDWSVGGDGNVWDSMSYDPELDLLYVGTGNGGWLDQPQHNLNGGDNLFVCSILAVRPETGRLVWYYQNTPRDKWDFDATQDMILANLKIAGRTRKVLMQAPKNGFFYVLDRETGKVISAQNYVRANWASRIDLKTGRPVETDAGDYTKGPRLVFPSDYGGHNWMPMSFNPETGLVYIPARDTGTIFSGEASTWFEEGYDLSKLTKENVRKQSHGSLIAWDPVAQKAVWTVTQKTLTNGGTLTTAGGIVAQGTEDGHFRIYDARNGRLLRDIFVGTGIVAPPVSYAIDGVQYIAFAVGWNGIETKPAPPGSPPPYSNSGRLIVLKIGGSAVPVAERQSEPPLLALKTREPVAEVKRGATLYYANCARCHGYVGERSIFPDLRRMPKGSYDSFRMIVLDGVLKDGGMASFADVLKPSDADAIRAFVTDWAQRSRRKDASPQARKHPAR